jgi:hypothetical protein
MLTHVGVRSLASSDITRFRGPGFNRGRRSAPNSKAEAKSQQSLRMAFESKKYKLLDSQIIATASLSCTMLYETGANTAPRYFWMLPGLVTPLCQNLHLSNTSEIGTYGVKMYSASGWHAQYGNFSANADHFEGLESPRNLSEVFSGQV